MDKSRVQLQSMRDQAWAMLRQDRALIIRLANREKIEDQTRLFEVIRLMAMACAAELEIQDYDATVVEEEGTSCV